MSSDLRTHLLAIRDKHGYLDPEVLLREARDKKHPLHDRFEWNDSIAAEAYRREQAHQLIRVVRVPHDGKAGPTDVRAFLAVPREGRKQPIYEPVEEILMDDLTRKVVLAAMDREWKALRARYGHLVEFGDLLRSAVTESAA